MFKKLVREFKRLPKVQQVLVALAIGLVAWWAYKKFFLKEGFNGDVESTVKCTLYYTTWCPHCKAVKPDWEIFRKEFDGQKVGGKTVIVVAVDGDQDKEATQAAGVKGYPTITFSKDGAPAVVYNGERSLDGFKKYLMQI